MAKSKRKSSAKAEQSKAKQTKVRQVAAVRPAVGSCDRARVSERESAQRRE